MLLVNIHGRPRNGRKGTTIVFQNAGANGDALVTDISPRIVIGARNKFRDPNPVIFGKTSSRGRSVVYQPASPLHPSTLENTVVLGRSSCSTTRFEVLARAQGLYMAFNLTSAESLAFARQFARSAVTLTPVHGESFSFMCCA
jgi:hypothetical protein